MGDEGLELNVSNTGKNGILPSSGPTSGPIGPDLQLVIGAWPHLSEKTRREILATIRSESLKGGTR